MRAVVFDLDDTLYPEAEFVTGGLRAAAGWAAAQLSCAPGELEAELVRASQRSRGKTFDAWLEQRGLPAEWRETMVDVYRGHVPTLHLFADAARALARLRGKVKLGLVTEGEVSAQHAKVSSLGLSQTFDAVVILGRDEADDWKPSPVPFERCLAALQIAGREAAYVGDNPRKDFRGARRLGMRTARVRRLGGVYAALEPATPADAADTEMADLDHLESALGLRLEGAA